MQQIPNIIKRLVKLRHLSFYLGLLLVNTVLFGAINPIETSPPLVISGFLLAAVDVTVLTYLCIRFLGVLFPSITVHKRRLTVLIASFEIVVLGLSSMGQLGWHDLLVVLIVGAVGYFYSLYFKLKPNRSS